jgi:hypothetical protein
VVWWGARDACAEVSTGSVDYSKNKRGPGFRLESQVPYGAQNIRKITIREYLQSLII